MRFSLWILFFFGGVVLVGCSRPGRLVYETEEGDRSLMLCEVAKSRVTMMRRFSFDIPEIFQRTPCGVTSSGFLYDKEADAVYIGTAGVFQNGNLESHTARYSFSFVSNARSFDTLVGRETFSKYIVARGINSPALGRPDKVDKVQVGNNDCDRYSYLPHRSNIGGWVEKIEYWCWEKQSGLSVPFHVEASQRQEQGSDGIDMEKEFIQPFFDSLVVNHMSSVEVESVQRNRQKICEDQKKRFDENRMSGDDYPDRRFFRTRLHYCGYDFPLPDLGVNL